MSNGNGIFSRKGRPFSEVSVEAGDTLIGSAGRDGQPIAQMVIRYIDDYQCVWSWVDPQGVATPHTYSTATDDMMLFQAVDNDERGIERLSELMGEAAHQAMMKNGGRSPTHDEYVEMMYAMGIRATAQ